MLLQRFQTLPSQRKRSENGFTFRFQAPLYECKNILPLIGFELLSIVSDWLILIEYSCERNFCHEGQRDATLVWTCPHQPSSKPLFLLFVYWRHYRRNSRWRLYWVVLVVFVQTCLTVSPTFSTRLSNQKQVITYNERTFLNIKSVSCHSFFSLQLVFAIWNSGNCSGYSSC